ncbi:small multi-drug export protein [Candidatus Woesearchaeota archaeon]|nr:small multi-drug export protein [Candidatus Woesearchaeota archaeon]
MVFNIFKIIFVSLLPIAELRGGIPLGLSMGMNVFLVYFIAVLSNLLVFPIVYIFLNSIHNIFMKFDFYRKTFERFLKRVRRRVHKKIEKYGYLGLTLFVAIPLPITGAYTGTLAAWFFKMNWKKSFLAVALGVFTAGIIVSLVCLFGIRVFNIFIKI